MSRSHAFVSPIDGYSYVPNDNKIVQLQDKFVGVRWGLRLLVSIVLMTKIVESLSPSHFFCIPLGFLPFKSLSITIIVTNILPTMLGVRIRSMVIMRSLLMLSFRDLTMSLKVLIGLRHLFEFICISLSLFTTRA